jgi:transcriptional regulator with XRE-family HTH domain
MDWKAIGRRARHLRIEKGWTQAQLGTRAHVTTNTIRGFERGTLNTRWPKIREIVKALGTTIETLAEPGEVVKPTDPRLVGLTGEDLQIARAYHDSQTHLRQRVMTLLRDGREEEASPDHRAEHDELSQRLDQLTPEQRQLFMDALDEMKRRAPGTSTASPTTTTTAPRTTKVSNRR